MSPTPGTSTTTALAAHLGLSRWAVSRALNRRPGVSAETVARVQSALGKLGFAPDPFARGLRGGRTGAVAMAVPAFDHPAAMGVAAALERELEPRGLRLELGSTGGDTAGEESVLRWFVGRRAEAVVVFASQLTASSPAIQALCVKNVPTFLIEPRADFRLSGVTVARPDHAQAMLLSVRHLHGLGHRRLGLVGFGGPDGSDGRVPALRRACEEHGIPWEESVRWIDPADGGGSANLPTRPPAPAPGGHLPGSDKSLAAALTRGRAARVPTAVIAADDDLALRISRALLKIGCEVPRDFSVVGYGNGPAAAGGAPALTTVDPQLPQAASRIAALLLECLRVPGRIETGTLWLSPLLVRRDSTAAPRAGDLNPSSVRPGAA